MATKIKDNNTNYNDIPQEIEGMKEKTLRSELNSAEPTIRDIMKNLGGLNDTEINKEFQKIDKQLNRRDIYANTKKPEYNNNTEYLLNGVNVGKLKNVSVSQGGDGSMDYIFNFIFEEGKSTETPYERSNDIISPYLDHI